MRTATQYLTIGAVTQALHLRLGKQLVANGFAKTGSGHHFQ
jgi:hypothetical protein